MTEPAQPVGALARGLGRAGLANVAITGVVAVLWYFSLTLVARRFGGTLGSDAYYFLFSLATVASGFLTSLFGAIFLPIYIELKMRQGLGQAHRFALIVLSATVVVAAPAALLAALASTSFFGLVSKFTPVQIQQAHAVLVYFAPVFLVQVLAEFFRVIVLAWGRFLVVAAGAMFQPVLLIAALYFLGDRFHEEALAMSLLAARLALLALMGGVVWRLGGIGLGSGLSGTAALKRFLGGAAPYWSANVVTSLATFAFDYVATGLGAGVLSAVAYAQKLYTLPITVVITPILEIARTRFSEGKAGHAHEAFAVLHGRLLKFILYFAIPVGVLYAVMPVEIVSSIFQRGAFRAQDVAISAACLQVYALVIPLTALFMLNGRAVESSQKLGVVSIFGTVGNLASIAVTLFLVERMGYLGIPLAKLCVELCYFLPFGFVALARLTHTLPTMDSARAGLTALLAAIVPAAVYKWGGIEAALSGHFPSIPLLAMVLVSMGLAYGAGVVLLDGGLRRAVSRELRARTRQVVGSRRAGSGTTTRSAWHGP